MLFAYGAQPLSSFDFAELEAKVEALAAKPCVDPGKVPRIIDALNYDQYRAIVRSRERTLFNEKEKILEIGADLSLSNQSIYLD